MRFNLLIRVHSSGNLTKRLSSSRQVPSIQANPEGTPRTIAVPKIPRDSTSLHLQACKNQRPPVQWWAYV